MNGYTFAFLALLLATLAGAVYLAALGSIAAIVTLSILLTILVLSLGAGISLGAVKLMGDKEQRAFRDNAQENLSIMSALQSVQNKQNQALLQQLGTVARLPQIGSPDLSKSLLIEDAIFSELESGE